jgi:hypothetical protein
MVPGQHGRGNQTAICLDRNRAAGLYGRCMRCDAHIMRPDTVRTELHAAYVCTAVAMRSPRAAIAAAASRNCSPRGARRSLREQKLTDCPPATPHCVDRTHHPSPPQRARGGLVAGVVCLPRARSSKSGAISIVGCTAAAAAARQPGRRSRPSPTDFPRTGGLPQQRVAPEAASRRVPLLLLHQGEHARNRRVQQQRPPRTSPSWGTPQATPLAAGALGPESP